MIKVTGISRRGFILSGAFSLAGCGTTHKSFVTETMPNDDYMKKSPAERTAYLKAIDEEDKAIQAKTQVEYLAGRPIYTGNKQTGRTIQWDRMVNLVYIYPGHKPDGMGLETYGAIAFVTNKSGQVLYAKDGLPLKVFTNVAMQEDLLRAALKTFAGAVPAAFNGAIAAKIQTDACKENGCGGGVEFNQEIVSVGMGGQGGRGGSGGAAAAGAYSSSGASVTGGGCSATGCKSSLSPY